jgi:hypothetical protein
MTISLKVRVPKITEDDVLLNTPLPLRPEDITWVWRRRGFRAQDIMSVEMMDKNISIITYWDYVNDKPDKYVVKEPFDDIMLKWELAESSPVVFEEEPEEEKQEGNASRDEEDED